MRKREVNLSETASWQLPFRHLGSLSSSGHETGPLVLGSTYLVGSGAWDLSLCRPCTRLCPTGLTEDRERPLTAEVARLQLPSQGLESGAFGQTFDAGQRRRVYVLGGRNRQNPVRTSDHFRDLADRSRDQLWRRTSRPEHGLCLPPNVVWCRTHGVGAARRLCRNAVAPERTEQRGGRGVIDRSERTLAGCRKTPTSTPIPASTATTNMVMGWPTGRIMRHAVNRGLSVPPCSSRQGRWRRRPA